MQMRYQVVLSVENWTSQDTSCVRVHQLAEGIHPLPVPSIPLVFFHSDVVRYYRVRGPLWPLLLPSPPPQPPLVFSLVAVPLLLEC